MKTKFIMAAALLAVLTYSCSPRMSSSGSTTQTAQPDKPLDAEVTVATDEETLVMGKNLFENNCNRCHKLFSPDAYTSEQWQPIVAKMSRKAKLDQTQADAVYAYVSANAKK